MAKELDGPVLLGAVIILLFFVAGFLALDAWLIMIAIGISHSIDSQIPAIGFWACVPFGAIMTICTAPLVRTK